MVFMGRKALRQRKVKQVFGLLQQNSVRQKKHQSSG